MLAVTHTTQSDCSDNTFEQGATDIVVKIFGSVIGKTGIKRFINFSDNEQSILALTDAAARSLPFVESVFESCPVGDHHGSIEVSVRKLQRQMRAV